MTTEITEYSNDKWTVWCRPEEHLTLEHCARQYLGHVDAVEQSATSLALTT